VGSMLSGAAYQDGDGVRSRQSHRREEDNNYSTAHCTRNHAPVSFTSQRAGISERHTVLYFASHVKRVVVLQKLFA
jgi:hypothetical protein